MTNPTEIGNGNEAGETMRRPASKLGEDLSKTARGAGAAAVEVATAVQHSTEEIGRRAAASARGAAGDVHKAVREHPIMSVAAAAGAGTLIGLFLARRR